MPVLIVRVCWISSRNEVLIGGEGREWILMKSRIFIKVLIRGVYPRWLIGWVCPYKGLILLWWVEMKS